MNLINNVYNYFKNSFNSSEDDIELPEQMRNVADQLYYYRHADVILACPQTYNVARKFVRKNKIILFEDGSNMAYEDFALKTKGLDHACIGVISPTITHKLITSESMLELVKVSCRTLILYNVSQNMDEPILRKTLHHSGFYEIAIPDQIVPGNFDYSSVGVLPDGTYDMLSSSPGSLEKEACVYVASRLSLTNYLHSGLNWRNVLGYPIQDSTGYISAPRDSFNIAVTKGQQPDSVSITIEGEFSWSVLGSGHTSLVGSYQGPSDMNMYAALLQLIDLTTVRVSLWRNDGLWKELATANVVVEPHDNIYSIQVSLSVSPTHVTIKRMNTTIIEYEDNLLKRTGVCGIRISSDTIALSNIRVFK
ncbi:hypothetical protein [Paenibacillus radicis (ex Gao et al. 2016)]|uniref:Uncharacterized protein n=1 Tax=Paenibacillus radicis (ex Gao et al. 2016) TaxID=1737354 RepID=A0A917M1Y1_9BACL|nr:hypothetical protein [Paenibacillus radicis (ex Gao et al. 2016)]GGG72232.1 hypothetical protein GCM10010918_29980 [Paenibacillus radicis (ex Gao et al. 2016)]